VHARRIIDATGYHRRDGELAELETRLTDMASAAPREPTPSPRPPPLDPPRIMPFLDQPTILEIHGAALSADLSRSRDALLVGIDARFVASLALASSPGAQLLLDLGALNSVGALTDGTVPLHTWLANAAHSAGPRREAAVFAHARDRVKASTATPESPRAGDPRADTLSRGQLPEALGDLLPAQLDVLIFKLGVPLALISGSMAPAATRSVEIVRWAEQGNRVAELRRLLAELTGPAQKAR
jgi:hypothetical protein